MTPWLWTPPAVASYPLPDEIVRADSRGGGVHLSVDAARYFIDRYTQPGQRVLDPFVGLGSVLVGCAVEGRAGLGLERDHHRATLARGWLTTLASTEPQEVRVCDASQGAAAPASISLVLTQPPQGSVSRVLPALEAAIESLADEGHLVVLARNTHTDGGHMEPFAWRLGIALSRHLRLQPPTLVADSGDQGPTYALVGRRPNRAPIGALGHTLGQLMGLRFILIGGFALQWAHTELLLRPPTCCELLVGAESMAPLTQVLSAQGFVVYFGDTPLPRGASPTTLGFMGAPGQTLLAVRKEQDGARAVVRLVQDSPHLQFEEAWALHRTVDGVPVAEVHHLARLLRASGTPRALALAAQLGSYT